MHSDAERGVEIIVPVCIALRGISVVQGYPEDWQLYGFGFLVMSKTLSL